MTTNTMNERFALLKEYGFENPPICDLLTVFNAPNLALDTKMSVSGDHGDERAYIYYASKEVGGELLDGLFYLPSLLEQLYYTRRGGEWSFEPLLEELNDMFGCELRLVFISGYPAIFSKIYEISWSEGDLRFDISDMLKIVGASDYLLTKEIRQHDIAVQ